jgi:hypothetical protein
LVRSWFQFTKVVVNFTKRDELYIASLFFGVDSKNPFVMPYLRFVDENVKLHQGLSYSVHCCLDNVFDDEE